MKHFITILSAIILMALSFASCEKTLTVEFKDNIDSIQYTNTVSINGDAYTLSELSVYPSDDGVAEFGITGSVFIVEGSARRLVATASIDGSNASTYETVSFLSVIPTSNYGKIYNLKDKNTYGVVCFGTGNVIEFKNGGGLSVSSTINRGSMFISAQNGNTSKSITGTIGADYDTGEVWTASADPKKATYYFDIERIYRDVYKVYIEYTDANGDKYVLSYKGDKEL